MKSFIIVKNIITVVAQVAQKFIEYSIASIKEKQGKSTLLSRPPASLVI